MMIDFSSGFSVFTSGDQREVSARHISGGKMDISLFLIKSVCVTFRVQQLSEAKVLLSNVEG